jgi:hypothetical protein
MKRYILIFKGTLVLIAWLGVCVSSASAQGTVISPVNPAYPFFPYQSSLTVSILDASGRDITAEWDPQPGQKVCIKVNNYPGSPVALEGTSTDPISYQVLKTSAYPGVCTNYDGPNPNGPDFSLNGLELTVNDPGGMAVIKVSATDGVLYFFILPQDSDFDGIPDWYERKFCGSNDCLNRVGDIDTVPEGVSQSGDGIANIDEYRGFRVGGSYVRGNPLEKDIFVHFVENAQCTGTASETDGSGSPIQLTTFYKKSDGTIDFTPLFGDMNTLMPGRVIHQLKSDELVDNFDFYSDATVPSVHLKTGTNSQSDRQINKNSLSPLGIVKAVRLVECLDLLKASPLGLSSKQPPDGADEDDGTAVIFTQRIWKSYKSKFVSGAGRLLKYFTYSNLSWGSGTVYPGQPPTGGSNQGFLNHQGVFNLMKDQALPFYAAHESLGHGLDLTPTQEGTSKNPVGYHHVEGTGTNIDISIMHKIDSKAYPNGFNNFYIPKLFGISDKRSMRLYGSQQ